MKAQFIPVGEVRKQHIYAKEKDTPFLSDPLHFHELCELVFIKESSGKRIVGDSIQDFSAGDLVLMGPHLPHIWYNDPDFKTNPYGLRAKATVIYFTLDFLNELADEDANDPVHKLMANARRGMRFEGRNAEEVRQMIMAISKTSGLDKINRFLTIMNLLARSNEFEFLSGPASSFSLNQNDTRRINDVYLFLLNNFRRDIFLDEVARIACMTPNSFCRFFRNRTQKSFTTFLNELRVEHACKLLRNDKLSIREVCYESGFNNITQFNKFFKRIKNITPLIYRQQLSR